MTDFQRQVYLTLCMSGRTKEAEEYMKSCGEGDETTHGLTEEEARKKAQERVFCDMGRSDIEDECHRRGIKVVKNRGKMEAALIEALTKEYMK